MPVQLGGGGGGEGGDGRELRVGGRLPISRSTGSRRYSGSSIQPIRQPVIEKYLDTDPITTASRLVCHALAHSRP